MFFRDDLLEKEKVNVKVPHKKNMLCLNENPLNPLKFIENDFFTILKNEVDLNRYFSTITKELEDKLCAYVGFGLDKKNFIYGNGADEMLYYLFTAVKDNNAFALSLSPSYFDYKSYSGAVGLNIVFQSLNNEFDFDEDKFLSKLNNVNCKLGILCNPNNPTGNLLDYEKIEYIIRNTDKLILVDETYYEFSNLTFADKIKDYDNLVIIRSFSKSFAAAGVRFGYLLSNNNNIREIEKVKTVFNMSLLIQAFIVSILNNLGRFKDNIEKIINIRQELFESLNSRDGIIAKPSYTNFLIFSIGENTKLLFDYLAENDFALRDIGNHPVLENFIRVSIGTKKQNCELIKLIDNFFKKGL